MIAEIHLPAKKVQTLYSIIEFNNKHEATAPEQLSFEILVGINPYPAPLRIFFLNHTIIQNIHTTASLQVFLKHVVVSFTASHVLKRSI